MRKYLFILAVSLVVLSACSNQKESTYAVDESLEGLAYNMNEQKWSPEMAGILKQMDNPIVADTYKMAMEHSEVLDHMPCYCGCFESSGHESNTHCFLDGVNDGVAQLDNMGLG